MENDRAQSAEEIVRGLRDMLPPQVDYAELVASPVPSSYGIYYVWEDQEPYTISAAADLIEVQAAEIAELRAKVGAEEVLPAGRYIWRSVNGDYLTVQDRVGGVIITDKIVRRRLYEYERLGTVGRFAQLSAENAEMQAQLAASQQEMRAAVEFIRHLDREYSHYIADRGFEQWRGPQEAGEENHGN